MRRAVCLPMLALSVACAATPTGAEREPGPPAVATPAPVLDASPEPTLEAARVEVDASDASLDAGAEAAPPALAADGNPCAAGSECESGICEGLGCDYATGECVEKARSCSAKLAWYCGCDGSDFQASTDCPGRRFAYRARCASARAWGARAAPDGAPCLRATQCKSGVCEGEGCDDAHPGTCQPEGRGCGQSAVQYCGCDGRPFSSNPCPGKRYASTGYCPVDPDRMSVIKVLAVTGKNAKVNAELEAAFGVSERLRRCHLQSGEKTAVVSLELSMDRSGRSIVQRLGGLTEDQHFLAGCVRGAARAIVVKAAADATGTPIRATVKLRLQLTKKP